MVFQVIAFKLRLKGWKWAKSEDLALVSALEPKGCDWAHASSARKARVALSAIASPAAPWVFKAITCARAHGLWSSTHSTALERTAYDRVHPRDLQHISFFL